LEGEKNIPIPNTSVVKRNLAMAIFLLKGEYGSSLLMSREACYIDKEQIHMGTHGP
jgi:hypothetical protein